MISIGMARRWAAWPALMLISVMVASFPGALAGISVPGMKHVAALKVPGMKHVASKISEPSPEQHLLNEIKMQDTCKTIYSSKRNGYGISEYQLVTDDGYVLRLHRLLHPSDRERGFPVPGRKKPYLLLHGLVGSSASFVRTGASSANEPERPASEPFNLEQDIERSVQSNDPLAHLADWESTADSFRATHAKDASKQFQSLNLIQHVTGIRDQNQFAHLDDLNFDMDSLNFGQHFRLVYKQYRLPNKAKAHLSNSLAFTLSNMGHDVWLINLRGSQYSRDHAKGPEMSADAKQSKFWEFDLAKLAQQDLRTVVDYVKTSTEWRDPMALIAYSYSNLIVMNMLSRFPAYQETLQPIVMMAPGMLSSLDRSDSNKLLLMTLKKLMTKNGPFPSRLMGHSPDTVVKKLLCKLPIGGNLCRLMELSLTGQTARLVGRSDRQLSMVKRDIDCGQTSLAVLHQIMENLSTFRLDPNFKPFVAAKNKLDSRRPVRRNIILVHSLDDEIATPGEVRKIRDSALKLLTLADYTIREPNFGHTDFLFSPKNQFLVNAEIARMTGVFDFLLYRKKANQPTGRFTSL